MEVVAHRVLIGKALEVGNIAGLNVVKAQRGRSFAGGLGVRNIRQVIVGEAGKLATIGGTKRRLRDAVGAGSYSDFNIRKQLAVATGGISARGLRYAAIQLLPHLVEAVNWAGRIIVVKECRPVGELERAGWQGCHVGDALIRRIFFFSRASAG